MKKEWRWTESIFGPQESLFRLSAANILCVTVGPAYYLGETGFMMYSLVSYYDFSGDSFYWLLDARFLDGDD